MSVSTPAGSWASALGRGLRRPRTPLFIVVALAAWLTVVANVALWKTLMGIVSGLWGLATLAIVGVIVFFALLAFLAPTAWARGMKPVWIVILVAAALAQYFMLNYGVVLDTTMLLNVGQTNRSEALELLNPPFVIHLLLVAALPAALIGLVPVAAEPLPRSAVRCATLLAVALSVTVLTAAVFYSTLAPLVRNHMGLRYLANPIVPVVSLAKAIDLSLWQMPKTIVRLDPQPTLGPSHAVAGAKPPLIVVVIGETARADHFALNGYPRPTTPLLASHDLYSFRNAWSCGTSTVESVPCMFSPLGRSRYLARSANTENLLDLAAAAGLAVLWIDNQAGCKGVCDRVPHASTTSIAALPSSQAICSRGECLDEALLVGLDVRIAALPAEQRERGVLLVLHMMGSHGPAYWRRSPPRSKRFVPECTTTTLADCGTGELINAYDNTIVYSDEVLARLIDQLAQTQAHYAPGLLYVSDHGESLGEYGFYLHGLPYSLAPESQKHVPLILWLSPVLLSQRGLDGRCIGLELDRHVGHDNLYPTVLGLLDITSTTYLKPLDLLAPCRTGD